MASRQQIKRRIGSVKNTKQITRAMQLVAASKLRRAQEAVALPRPYAQAANELLATLQSLTSPSDPEARYFERRVVKRRLIVLITSSQGLAGAYDANVLREFFNIAKADQQNGIKTAVICLGRKGAVAAGKLLDVEIIAAYSALPDHPSEEFVQPLIATITEQFTSGKVDAVNVLYTQFISMVRQSIENHELLPAGSETTTNKPEPLVEPSVGEVLETVTTRLIGVQLYQALLDAIASEQSMRMLAMKNATDNANDLIDALTLAYNTARQAAITQELAEITGGAEAMA